LDVLRVYGLEASKKLAAAIEDAITMCTFSTIKSASTKKNQNITKIAQDMQTSKHHVETLTEH